MTWPVELRGVTESVVTTAMQDDAWNVAALGLHAGDPVTARTWGDTRTRRNFARTGTGYIQFVHDPVVFVNAALGIREVEQPILEKAAAWVEVSVQKVDSGSSNGTSWIDWTLDPIQATVRDESIPTINRGFNAVIEATVAASRLDVPTYDSATLERRLEYFASVARHCGGEREQAAFDRLESLVDAEGWV